MHGNSTNKNALAEQFISYLDAVAEQDEVNLANYGNEQTDMYSLYTALSALKSEVKIESKQIKSALDTFKSVFSTLEDSHELLRAQARQQQSDLSLYRDDLLRPLLLNLLDMRDRLCMSISTLEKNLQQKSKKGFWSRLFRSSDSNTSKFLIESLYEGQNMSLRRLDQTLEQQGVTILEVIREPFNAEVMRAVNTESIESLDDGIVTQEIRAGFQWEGRLLRAAEVNVNKL